MNIVFVTTLYPDSEKQTLTQVPYTLHYFVKQWIADGHNVQVIKSEAVYPKFAPYYSKRNKVRKVRDVKIDGVDIHVVQSKMKYNMDYSEKFCTHTGKKTVAFLKDNNIKCDVVIFHVFSPNFYIAKEIKKYYDVPMVFGIHKTDINVFSKVYLKKRVINATGQINALAYRAYALKRKFQNYYKVNKANFIAPSGIPNKIAEKRAAIFNEQISFITVGKLVKQKNNHTLIKSFAKLIQEYQNISLKIIGEGKEKKKLINLARKLGIENNVFFLGYMQREDVFQELKGSDIFVMPSTNETFGLVYLEAMAKGCITIGTVNDGIDGVITDGENGFLCKPTIEGCYVKMKQALELDEAQRNKILDNTYETALKYTEENCAREYIKNIEVAINN